MTLDAIFMPRPTLVSGRRVKPLGDWEKPINARGLTVEQRRIRHVERNAYKLQWKRQKQRKAA